MLGYWAVKIIGSIICLLPNFICNIIANGIGEVAWQVIPAWRKFMAVENVKNCLGVGTERAEEITKASVTRFGRMVIEVLHYPKINKDNFHQLVKFEGLEYLEAAYRANKGVVMCTAHYGNWELLGGSMALLGYPILSITRKQNNGGMDKLINEYRTMIGQHVAYNHGENSMLAIGRYLKEKHLVGILYDQDTGADGEHLEFFGKPSVVPQGAAYLSRLFGAPIIPLFMHNNPDGTLTAKIYPPLYTPKTTNRNADVSGIMKELVVIAQQEIINDPTMWFWVHDRWKDGRKKYKLFKEGKISK